MNILFISYGLFPCKIGGVEIFNYYLIDALNNRKHNTYLITSCEKETGLKTKIYIIKKIKYIPSKIIVPIVSFFIILKLRNKIDLIHAPYTGNSWIYGFFLPLTKKLFKIPYVLMIHGGGMHEWGLKAIRKILFKHSDVLIGVSENIKNEYEKRSRKKVVLLPNLIPQKPIIKTKQQLKNKYKLNNKTVFLYLGSIKKIKGTDTLIEAFIQLGIKYIKRNNLRLIIIGSGPLKITLSEKINSYGFEKHIKFVGFVNENIKYEYLRLSDVFVIPSQFEAQSLSLLDAMACGCAIIGSNTNGINNIINDRVNGLLFTLGDIKDLTNKIKILVENKALLKELSKMSQEYHKKYYNYDQWLDKMINVYKKTMIKKDYYNE